MNELEATYGRVLRVWRLVLWRSVDAGALLGFVAGFIIGLAVGLGGGDKTLVASLSTIAGLILGLGANIFFFRSAFRKKFLGFRIAMIAA